MYLVVVGVATEKDAAKAVAGDEVACVGSNTTYYVVCGKGKFNAVESIRDGGGAGDVGANVVANDLVVCGEGGRAGNDDAAGVVARNEITFRGGATPNEVVDTVLHVNPCVAVAQIGRSADVAANEVARHDVAVGIVDQIDTVTAVSGNHISHAANIAPDAVVIPLVNHYPIQ